MADFIQGQRWLVDSELELGLGMVQSVEARAVTLYFPECDTERQYALQNAPLTRLILEVGDSLEHREQGSLEIAKVHELNGLVIYETPEGQMVPETELADAVKRNNPVMRLLTGQTDHPNWFSFRSALNRGTQAIWNAQLNGLLGTRSNLLPHQLYVAKQATEHTHVRALLADEVGLGKTIEAGLIINRLAQQGRAKRILIAVPEALQAQWLVELIRRFSLFCEMYQDAEHDFAIGQVHLVTHKQLKDLDTLLEIESHSWDMLVVDEAHHLPTNAKPNIPHWSELAASTDHLLLLTATPEQLGLEAHFGRLHLLDSGRFVSFEQYQQDEQAFSELTELASALNAGSINNQQQAQLTELGIHWPQDSKTALSALLDRHGTGRVVYRNTRKGVQGFHDREAEAVCFNSDDERVKALADWLKNHLDEKILLITHSKDTAKQLGFQLRHEYAIDASVFHEELDLIERDRAAAHFADAEDGSQVLVCSEIGGEGRNFQFCRHLILWDIPNHPDMLEQRIGRLDRIGQTSTIQIHAFLLEQSQDLGYFNWYHSTLNCINQIQPAAGAIHEQYAEAWFTEPSDALAEQINQDLQSLTQQLEQGRDVLLELNSCRQPEADSIKEEIEQLEQNHPLAVVEMAANLLNLHFESIAQGIYELIPSSNMMIPMLPGIPEGGALVTFSREIACGREDTLFLSWEHPFIQGLLDILEGTDLGQASIAVLETEQVPAGSLLLEVQWSVNIPGLYQHSIKPHINESVFRTLVLEGGKKDLNDVLKEDALQQQVKAMPVKVARKMIREAKERISPLYDLSQTFAKQRFSEVIEQASNALNNHNAARLERMTYLAGINKLVTEQDIEALSQQIKAETAAMAECEFTTSSTRLVLCAPPGTL
ncbi:helicase-related protein [Reinekea thalattae]|uniref:RNA polymerase-associated protein RapA n=1 Tax=Reinekea thalattae TaxID=2593301 RepID=A0A5C8Z848_9GAMM|nr:helicase-related protein [Reinekea thalattae]TXR53473.1 RNA polymerase-associated protein RapA [Reinekea thalattae]